MNQEAFKLLCRVSLGSDAQEGYFPVLVGNDHRCVMQLGRPCRSITRSYEILRAVQRGDMPLVGSCRSVLMPCSSKMWSKSVRFRLGLCSCCSYKNLVVGEIFCQCCDVFSALLGRVALGPKYGLRHEMAGVAAEECIYVEVNEEPAMVA